MATITLDLRSGQHVDFDVALGLDGPAYFMFGVRRSGSSLFTNLVKALSEANQRNFIEASRFFDNDIRAADWQSDPALHELVHPGNVYGGFRDMPLALFDNELLRTGRRLLLVRDPRDTLVSLYFSMAYSHPLPDGKRSAGGAGQSIANRRARARRTSIDDFVLTAAAPLRHTLIEYSRLMEIPGTVVFRYEEVIFDKRAWLTAIARAFDWTATDQVVEDIVGWADVRPTGTEDPTAFVRHITPGDHLDKLKPATIVEIDRILQPAFEVYGYA